MRESHIGLIAKYQLDTFAKCVKGHWERSGTGPGVLYASNSAIVIVSCEKQYCRLPEKIDLFAALHARQQLDGDDD